MTCHSKRAVAFGLALAFPFTAVAEPTLSPVTRPLVASAPFEAPGADDGDVKKFRRSVSGVACAANGLCLLAFDERAEARFARITERRFEPLDAHVVLDGGSDVEIDAEGAATDGAYFYVTGSHASKRKACVENPASRVVYRFRADGAGAAADLKASRALWDALTAAGSPLRDYAGKPTGTTACASGAKGQRGLDIEGMAVLKGRLYLGFRGPAEDGKTWIASVDAAALFDGPAGAIEPRIEPVEVGADSGIRDMTATADGLLLLIGPDDDHEAAPPPWRVARWAPEDWRHAKTLATLDAGDPDRSKFKGCKDKAPKPEALAAPDPANPRRLLVLSDGLCDGGPMWFELPG